MSKKDLSKGNTALLILSLLNQKEMYGYQIIQELEAQSEKVFCLKEGTLYPILHTLEKEGSLEAFWETMESGRKRKYYRITPNGREALKSQCKEWNIYSNAVNNIVNTKAFV